MAQATVAAEPTALDEFVYADDPDYAYRLVDTELEFTHTRYVLHLTSGAWRSEAEVDRRLWTHWVTVYVPHRLVRRTALLVVSGGSNESLPDFDSLDDSLGAIALLPGSVIVDLGQVPNQPLQFAGEEEPRSEDALIAYSWKRFLENPADEQWPAQLPMTRAAVRAMDAVQDHLRQVRPDDPIDDFIVAGASKRGWTSWLAAAVENGPLGGGRVSAVVPMVIDVLNAEKSFDHHFKVYGFWAPAVGDYVEAGVMDHLGTPELAALFDLVDPYAYRERLTMPKFILNSAGDQFFAPDSWKFYYRDLPGFTWLRYFPNTDHSLSQVPDPLEEILPLYYQLVSNGPESVPAPSWSVLEDGTIRLQTDEQGVEVRLWQATNPEARDFRYESIGPAYSAQPLADQGGGVFTGTVAPPADGWIAYFLEVTFSDGTAASSGVHVTAKPEDIVLRIERDGEDVALRFNSKPGEWYQVQSGATPAEMEVTDTLVPQGSQSEWVDPDPQEERKFYRIESVRP